MLKLAEASSFFDRTEARDPDSGALLFFCQVDPYDDSRRDAGSAYRRIMSVAADITIPNGRAVNIFGQTWLIGAKQMDGLGEVHRVKYVLQTVFQKVNISRLNSYLNHTSEALQWASLEWSKDSAEIDTSSSMPQTYFVHLADGSDVRDRDILWTSDDAFIVVSTHDQPSGYRLAHCIRLDPHETETAQLQPRTYSGAQGTYIDGAPVAVSALRVRWRSLFIYGSQSDARYKEGDISLVLPLGTSIGTDTRVELGSNDWQVMSSEDLSGAVVAHVRRA